MNIDFNTYVGIGTLIATVIAAVGLIAGIRVYRRQMNAQVFIVPSEIQPAAGEKSVGVF